jgi:hypothetical protein
VSFKGLLVHRCDVYRLDPQNVDGAASYSYAKVASDVRCRVDLSFLRAGKDQGWTPEAGRSSDRTGVAFFLTGANILPGDRILMKKGPTGTFLLEGTLDEVQDGLKTHHLEVGVTEVAKALGRS